MKIINNHEDINLALCIKNKVVKKNIEEYCLQKNFDFKKIIFLDPLEHEENLKRISTFDL